MSTTNPFHFARNRSTWLTPVVLIAGLAVLFPAIYLSATVDPAGNLDGLPVGLVVTTQSAPDGQDAESIADAIAADAPPSLAIERLTPAELSDRMADDSIAGAIVIPSDFNESISSLLPGAGQAPTTPTIEIRTNAGDGGISNGLLNGTVTPLLTEVEQQFGASLVGATTEAGASLSAAEQLVLSTPFDIRSIAFTPLPANAGLGTSAFYYSLILVLLGFVGASVINPFVDSALGFAPSELGPLVARRPYLALSRLHTLLVKFGVIVATAPLAALLVAVVAGPLIGVPISDPVQLWLFSSAAIAAIGVSALTVFAIFGGGIGSLVNTLFFIALSMTSSGGTVPLAATPAFFRWASTFEPFHAVLAGVRSILYFDANPAAGLSEAWIRVAIGAAFGLSLGVIATTLYARKRMFTRHPRPATA